MNQSIRQGSSNKPVAAVWKRIAIVTIVAALVVGFAGCAMDDLLAPFVGDVPFEQQQETPPEMGAVDNTPTVPDDDDFDNVDLRPFP